MPTFKRSIEINAEPSALFALTQDYDRRLAWDPLLKVATLHGLALAVGVRAWCVAHNGLGMETEYITFKPPHHAAIKMTKGPRILAAFAGAWRFQEIAPGRTRVTFAYHLVAAPRPLRFMLDPIIRVVCIHDVEQRLLALKHAAEMTDILHRTEQALPL